MRKIAIATATAVIILTIGATVLLTGGSAASGSPAACRAALLKQDRAVGAAIMAGAQPPDPFAHQSACDGLPASQVVRIHARLMNSGN